jgi:ABC-2 type transport system ATP-binding protein
VSAAPLVAQLAAKYPLLDLSVREPDIEAVIAKMYAGGASGPTDARLG